MARTPISTWFFALVVVRLGHRFLLVHERKHGQRWYFPGGRVEVGETLAEAALRETKEEAGLPIVLDGIYRVEHSPSPDGTARMRVWFAAHPADDTLPKSVPDEETLGAGWFTKDELQKLPLRGQEVRTVIEAIEGGLSALPLSLWTYEGASWDPGQR